MTAAVADSRPHGITRYKHGPDQHGGPGKGCRCADCRLAVYAYDSRRARLIAYGRWERPLDAAGTRRRLQALIWSGWSPSALARRQGRTEGAVRKMLRYERVSPATAAAVRALTRALWDQPPPQGTPAEKRAATMARRYAAERGWVPLCAWDDEIDDPAATPVDGWDRGNDDKREYGTLTAEALELIGFGLDERQAAERLGVSAGTLSVTLARARRVQAPSGSPAVAAAIREARVRAGLTQRRLAAVVDVTEVCVQLWERAQRTPGPESWVQLELTLGPLGVVRDTGPEPRAAKADRDAA